MENPFTTPFPKNALVPQEAFLDVKRPKDKLFIGIPKEHLYQERRVCLTPDAVAVLIANEHSVVIESGAGLGANFSDKQYAEAGALVTENKKMVLAQPLVLKVMPPTLDELEYIKPKSFIISGLQFGLQSKSYFESLAQRKVIALAFNYIKDGCGHRPLVRIMSEITGSASILIASELLSSAHDGMGLLMGSIAGVRPAEVVILGAGTVGEYAARAAVGLGVTIKVFDNDVSRLRRLQNNLNQRVYTSTINPKLLGKAIKRCDVLIGALKPGIRRTPVVVTEEMVRAMKPKSIIIDVSVDNGGCIETIEVTTHAYPTFEKYGVIHYGVTNIPSRVARSSTRALSNFFLPHLIEVAEQGGLEALIRYDLGFREGVYLYKGIITKKNIGDWFKMPCKDINLLTL